MLLWGLKDVSLFDIWAIIHILSGMSLSSILIWLTKTKNKDIKSNKKIIISVLLTAYIWEILEYSFEIGLFGNALANWFYAVEFLPNRLIVDPLTVFIGCLVAIKRPRIGIPAAIVAATFFLIHIFIFPNVVYLQKLITK